jgi:hypothetical protein
MISVQGICMHTREIVIVLNKLPAGWLLWCLIEEILGWFFAVVGNTNNHLLLQNRDCGFGKFARSWWGCSVCSKSPKFSWHLHSIPARAPIQIHQQDEQFSHSNHRLVHVPNRPCALEAHGQKEPNGILTVLLTNSLSFFFLLRYLPGRVRITLFQR